MLTVKAKVVLIGTAALVAFTALMSMLPYKTKAETEPMTIREGTFIVNQSGQTEASIKARKAVRLSPSPDQVITFDVPVLGPTVDLLIVNLKLMQDNGIQDAYVLIDSPGGSVLDGGRLIAFMKASKMHIHTVCIGLCASMAAQIHQQGYTRLMYTKSTLMFHQATSKLQGSLEQMSSQLNWIKRYVDRLDFEVAQRSKVNYNQLKSEIASELWMEAPEAIDRGFSEGMVYVDQSVMSLMGRTISSQAARIGLKIDPSFTRNRRMDFTY